MQRIFSLRFLSILIFLLFFNILCVDAVFAQNLPTSDEYLVYTSLLQKEFVEKRKNESVELMIKENTDFSNMFPKDNIAESLSESFQPILKETIADFAEAIEDFSSRNKKPLKLANKFDLRAKIILDDRKIDQINAEAYKYQNINMNEKFWEIFHKKYPNVWEIITLSRVGFNKEKNKAIVFVAFGCGELCGEGNFFLLIKKKGIWEIQIKTMVWVS